MLLSVIIIIFVIICWISFNSPSKATRTLCQNVKQSKEYKGVKFKFPCQVGIAMGEFVRMTIAQFHSDWTEQERLEVWYLLIYEIDQILINKYPKDRPIISDAFKANLLIAGVSGFRAANRAMEEYEERFKIYSRCSELIGKNGVCIGTRMLGLSYFMQKARGKVSGWFIEEIIIGERPFSEASSDDFMDPFESIELSFTVSNCLISCAKLLNQFANITTTKPRKYESQSSRMFVHATKKKIN